MTETELLQQIALGEHSRQQFKRTVTHPDALAFIKRNLHRVQGDQGFNSPGILEIPEIVLQELMVNALVRRPTPEKPNSRLQQYRLTEAGLRRLGDSGAEGA